MPFIHQTERTNKAVFSAIEDDPTPLPPTCFAMKFEVWRDTYVTIGIVPNSSPVYSERYKGITVEEVAQKISCEYCVFSFVLSTYKASDNNFSYKNQLATFVTTYPHFWGLPDVIRKYQFPNGKSTSWSYYSCLFWLCLYFGNWSLVIHLCQCTQLQQQLSKIREEKNAHPLPYATQKYHRLTKVPIKQSCFKSRQHLIY